MGRPSARAGVTAHTAPGPGGSARPPPRLPERPGKPDRRGPRAGAPEGVVLAYDPTLPVVARVAEGAPPFTWLWNGAPIVTGSRDREVTLEAPGTGFGALTVIDASGRAARVSVELAP